MDTEPFRAPLRSSEQWLTLLWTIVRGNGPERCSSRRQTGSLAGRLPASRSHESFLLPAGARNDYHARGRSFRSPSLAR